MLLLLCSLVINSTRQFILTLALHFVFVFFSPFSTAIKRELLCGLFQPSFVLGVLICVTFLFLLVSGLAATCNCGTLWTFHFTFLIFHVICVLTNEIPNLTFYEKL